MKRAQLFSVFNFHVRTDAGNIVRVQTSTELRVYLVKKLRYYHTVRIRTPGIIRSAV